MKREPTGLPVGVVSSILDSLPLAVLVLAADATTLYANPAALDLLGEAVAQSISAGDLMSGLGARQAGSGNPYPVHRMPIERAITGETATIDDLEVDGPAGAIVLEVWAAPVDASDSSRQCVVATFRDVAVRKGSEDRGAQLRDDILLQSRWLEAVAAIRDMAAPAADLDHALDVVAQRTLELLDVESISIAVPVEQGFLAIRAAEGRGAAGLKGTRVPVKGSIMGDVVGMGAAAVLDDIACLGTLANPIAGLDLGPALFVPVTLGERILGLLCVARGAGRALFTERELAAAQAFADQAAIRLDRESILLSVLSAQRRLSEAAPEPGELAVVLQDAIDTLASVALQLSGKAAPTDVYRPDHPPRPQGDGGT